MIRTLPITSSPTTSNSFGPYGDWVGATCPHCDADADAWFHETAVDRLTFTAEWWCRRTSEIVLRESDFARRPVHKLRATSCGVRFTIDVTLSRQRGRNARMHMSEDRPLHRCSVRQGRRRALGFFFNIARHFRSANGFKEANRCHSSILTGKVAVITGSSRGYRQSHRYAVRRTGRARRRFRRARSPRCEAVVDGDRGSLWSREGRWRSPRRLSVQGGTPNLESGSSRQTRGDARSGRHPRLQCGVEPLLWPAWQGSRDDQFRKILDNNIICQPLAGRNWSRSGYDRPQGTVPLSSSRRSAA